MNERIEELAKQASHQSPDGYPVTIPYSNDFVKVFAELIVRECAKVSENDVSDGDACCTNTAVRIAIQIKKHFGVE